ncbi:MAG: cyclic nucleotide-binding domain-containing protein [Proteobacteria bacterium]|nr:cyclic nucleotide-binding domain-containing protein [Pseudomonadota bacterium]
MSAKLEVSHDEISLIPLLCGFSGDELDRIIALCEPAKTEDGMLFEAGSTAEAFYLLTRGSVSLFQDKHESHKLHPIVIIGELGALTGRKRTTRAVVGQNAEVWQIRVAALNDLFESDKELGLHFQNNLLEMLADKLHRDQVRLQDMRSNIIHTQKAMKRMRDFLLESKDTVVSNPIHEVIDGLIKRNRRVNYRVDPPAALASTLRMDDGTEALVQQIARTVMTVTGLKGGEGDRISGVLYLGGPEIPISGRILRIDGAVAEIGLDLLFDEYADMLEGYLTRVQMLDFLV